MTGCSFFGAKPTLSTDTFCDKHFPLKHSEKVRQDIQKISSETFEYVKINETTFVCDCPASKPEVKKQQCWAKFTNLKKTKK